MDRHTRSSSKPSPRSSERSPAIPHIVLKPANMDIDSRMSYETINHWEFRRARFTYLRSAMTVFLILLSVPWPKSHPRAVKEDRRLVLKLYSSIATFAVFFLMLICFSWFREWMTDSKSEEVSKEWSDIIRKEMRRHQNVAVVVTIAHIVHRFAVPASNAWVLSSKMDCGCSQGPALEWCKTVVDAMAIFILSTSVVWIIPNRLALLSSRLPSRDDLIGAAVFGYAFCYFLVSLASLLVFKGFCYQIVKDGGCVGELGLRAVALLGKMGGKQLGMLEEGADLFTTLGRGRL